MDLQVKAAQIYLNDTYGGQSGYLSIAEDGMTGWQTKYAITRALQLELGITATSTNFGAGTTSAFINQVGAINSSTTQDRIVSLLRCALWCSGYPGGHVEDLWDSGLAGYVAGLRDDMGLAISPPMVTVKMMKSLLTMDAFVLLSGGNSAIRSGQRWLNGKYAHRQDFSLLPCDGLFTRQMQQGLVYAIQYELGMADGVANGNLGPGTSSGLAVSGRVELGDIDGTTNFVRLFQLALCCNRHYVAVDGIFGQGTRSEVLKFQAFMEIVESGAGDFGTWAGLLVSTGDVNRQVTGIDTTSTMTAQFSSQMRAAGYNVVGRYLTVDGKSIRPGELDTIFDYDFSLIPIFQNYNNGAQYFTQELGYEHGRQASLRARQLGLRDGVIIFFAVDYDATGGEANTIVLAYFDGVRAGLDRSRSVRYEVGVYATRNVATIVYDAGKASGVWVSGMSTGFSGNLGFPMPAQWMYNQIQEVHSINIDRNAVSVRARPATRSDVAVTPYNGSQYNQFYWKIVELEVQTEVALSAFPLVEPKFAGVMALHWLQSQDYGSVLWTAYTPYPTSFQRPALEAACFPAVEALRTGLYSAYSHGSSLAHTAATANGVRIWGSAQAKSTIEMGDLGGWALDTVQLWGAYFWTARPANISQWVHQRLGEPPRTDPSDITSQFDIEDVVADAEGWLIGSAMRDYADSFGDAVRRMLVEYPTETLRIRAFLHLRFGPQPAARIESAVKSIFVVNWPFPWPGVPRDEFMNYDGGPQADLPTASELDDFASAVASRLIVLAGL
ncbi:MAG: DUF1906 domain-containing protein [Salinibacterium sp.]|nr:glycoside hydrolase domain-containing protein [Salinibacterium sp.]MBF0671338.1 DUF1906 domain-containing protein [Salinibacterium sp.]